MKHSGKILSVVGILSLTLFSLLIVGCPEPDRPDFVRTPPLEEIPEVAEEVRIVVDDDYMDQVIEMIREAEESIHLAQLYINDDGAADWIVDELIKAAERGVEIIGVVNRDDSDDYQSERGIRRLQNVRANVNWAQRAGYGKLHAKMIIADQERLMLGSTNWSAMSIFNNNEANLYVDNPGLANFYVRWIEQLYLEPEADPEIEPVITEHFKTAVDRKLPELIKESIKDAEERVWIGLYIYRTYFNNGEEDEPLANKIGREIVAARERGVDVRIILDTSDYQDFINDLNDETQTWFAEREVEVRRAPEDVISHWKLQIFDDRALVSSMNWGQSGFNSHAEAGLLTSQPETVDALADYFLNMWEEAD